MWGKKDKSQFFFSKINIFLSITAFLGSYVIFCTWLIAATNSTTYEIVTINYQEIMYSPTYVGKERQISIFFLNNWLTFSSPSFLLPLTRKLPFVRRPNSCIAVWQQLICWLVLLASLSLLLMACTWFANNVVFVDTQGTRFTYQALHYTQCLC